MRIGKEGKPFRIYKFRSMYPDSEGKGKWNVGDKDDRITRVGHFLRKSKLDELPQLINVFKGEMSFVGPRPELKHYVDMYTDSEKPILDLKPGITDWASITNFEQFKFFTDATDPDMYYLKCVRPLKLRLQLYYRYNHNFVTDMYCIMFTIYKVIFHSQKLPKKIQKIVDEYKKYAKRGCLIMTSEELAWKIRRHGVEMTHLSGGGHIGSILSVADIIAVLYIDILKYDSNIPNWDERDRIILSKGHAGASIYAALAENHFFPIDELKTHYANGSRLSGHVSHYLPGIDFSTGSLGHGLSAGIGMAYAAKKDDKEHRVFVIMGDGECDEGSVWEAALFANHFHLDNLISVIDYNHMQSLDFCENTLKLENLANKWEAFGWNVISINGNNHNELKRAFKFAQTKYSHKPTMIIAHTIKGYGIPFMENDILWHYRFPHDGWEYDCAVNELHKNKPQGVYDPYTPNGIENPILPDKNADIYRDHTVTATWHPTKTNRI